MKRILPVLFIPVIAVLLLSACNSSTGDKKETKAAFDLLAAKKAVEDGNKNFMDLLRKGDSVGLANLYSSDADFMSPNMPAVKGRPAIQTAFAGFINAGMTGFNLFTTEVWGYDDLVSEVGTWTFADKDGKELDHGKYIVLWKMEDGKWKLHRDCWNADTPCQPSK
ncbi:MAG: DUF4440 domain-containing protein [Chitinophagaceae bacterium]|nr:MAG: DUF4440 domain-containing protein [Chitinophagaceae bacterium]